jgi:uncharacterized protein YeaO (DUF488 family)
MVEPRTLSAPGCARIDRLVAIRIVRLGTPRTAGEGLRIGTVRRPPRGVPKAEFATRGFYDVWLPELSPSAELVTEGRAAADDATFRKFRKSFEAEMRAPGAARLLDLLAALSQQTDFSVGCYCEHEDRCHRSVLRDLLRAHGARIEE